MPDRKSNFVNRFETTLTSGVGSIDLVFPVETTAGGPASPAYMVVDPDIASKVEVIYFDGTFDATNFRTTSTSNRHLPGSAATSGLTHDVGAKVVVVPVAQHYIDLHDRVDAQVAKSLVDAKGDLIVASAADTVGRLAVGADGKILKADSAQSLGVTWGNAPGSTIIEEKLLTISQPSILFSSIPNTYRHLRVVLLARSSAALSDTALYVRFNGDTGTNYDYQYHYSRGSAMTAANAVANSVIFCGFVPAANAPAGNAGAATIYIPHYTNTAFFKHAVSNNFEHYTSDTAGTVTCNSGGKWRSTSAITSLTLLLGSGDFTTDCIATLYGLD